MITKIKKGKRVVGPDGLGIVKKVSAHDVLVELDNGSTALYCQDPSKKYVPIYEVNLDPKYLKIPNINFGLDLDDEKKDKKYSKQRIENGFDNTETWCLYSTIAKFIVPRLEKFIEVTDGFINKDYDKFEIEKWKNINIVLEAFKLIMKDELTRQEEKIANKGLKLFPKIFYHLWW